MTDGNDNQPREPKGSPGAGRWAKGSNPEASGITLTSPEIDGSFTYPPVLRQADDVIRFWEHCPVEDATLDALATHCAKMVTRDVNARLAQWVQQTPAPGPNSPDRPTWDQAYQQKIAEIRRECEMPMMGDLRTIARLNRMMAVSAPMLDPYERERLGQQTFVLPASNKQGTAAAILRYYAADNIDLAAASRPTGSVDNAQLLAILRGMSENLTDYEAERRIKDIDPHGYAV